MKIMTFAEWVRDKEGLGPSDRWDAMILHKEINAAYALLSEYIDGYFTYVAMEMVRGANSWGGKSEETSD